MSTLSPATIYVRYTFTVCLSFLFFVNRIVFLFLDVIQPSPNAAFILDANRSGRVFTSLCYGWSHTNKISNVNQKNKVHFHFTILTGWKGRLRLKAILRSKHIDAEIGKRTTEVNRKGMVSMAWCKLNELDWLTDWLIFHETEFSRKINRLRQIAESSAVTNERLKDFHMDLWTNEVRKKNL